MADFLEREEALAGLHTEMRVCQLCLDAGHAITPGAVFRGTAVAKVMLIGQAPGVTEVEAKRPFNAGSGRRLFQWLGEAGWAEDDFRARQYMTAVTKCYPGKTNNGKGDRVPSKAEQRLCRPFLQREIELINPRLMILVGGLAIKLLYPAKLKLREVIGTAVYFPPKTLANPVNFSFHEGQWVHSPEQLQAVMVGQTDGRFVVPLPHPSGASLWPNKPANKALIAQAVQMLEMLREGWISG
ncbi:MAG: uracil-DNA glycosylase family protein [Ardenticatenaceae bacterium]|nr:uracil-DNA glycosylase family protein [Ardenticatenaceae bacterium]